MEIKNNHNPPEKFADYINLKIKILDIKPNEFHENLKLSKGELSKILNKNRKKISAKNFFNVCVYFNEDWEYLKKFIYPKLSLKEITDEFEVRNTFGLIMKEFESNIISYDPYVISLLTGIPIKRLKKLYLSSSQLFADELFLIEMAVNVKTGTIFQKLFK